MIDTEALLDQWHAQQRDYAGWCMRILQTYLEAGHTCEDREGCECVTFTRKEAMEMLHLYLDHLEDYAPH